MNSFTVCCYNVGSRVDDYFQLCRYLDPSLHFSSREEELAFHSKYATTQNRTTELLTNKAAVYCLQEVVDEKRPLIKSLRENNFEIVHLEGLPHFDTAIALDKSRFINIVNHSMDVRITSIFKKDVAIASATDILTGRRITFISAHAPGFDFTKTVNAADAAEGDFYCRAIAKKVSKLGNGTLNVMGADMNANPEKWNHRFQIFSRQGFRLNRTHSTTNVNPKDPVEQAREIDFIFSKATYSIFKKIKSIFFSTVKTKTAIKRDTSIGLNADDNASDHLPIFVDVYQKNKLSKIRKIWNATYHFLSSFLNRN